MVEVNIFSYSLKDFFKMKCCLISVHPFGIACLGIDMTKFPIYEIAYGLQFPTPLVLTVMYMPFVSLFAAFSMFGKTMLTILCHNLENVCLSSNFSEEKKIENLRNCIQYYSIITR